MGKRLTKKAVIDALHKTKGGVYLAADRLGVSHQTIYNYVNKYPDVSAIKEYYDGELVDIGELKMRQCVIDGEAWAVKYLLSTKGKNRGWVERQELTGQDGDELLPVSKIIEIMRNAGDDV